MQSRTPFRQAWDWVDFDSALLAGNALGDPTRRRFPAYTPPQYATEPKRRFPVAYYLVGYGSWGAVKLLEEKAFEEPLWARLDRQMLDGTLEPTLVVFVDAFTRLGGSQYRDSPATGLYAQHVAHEVVAAVDAQFRTTATRDERALMGKSSGGYGALWLAMTFPEVFGLCCATAADSYFPLSYVGDFGKALQAYHAAGGPAQFLTDFLAGKPRHKHWHTGLSTIAYAQAYAPDLAVPVLNAALPFDLDTGELREDVWQRWLACDPVNLVQAHAPALRSLRLLFLDAGRSDEWSLNFGHRVLASRLRALDVAHMWEEFDGGHMGIDHRIDESLRQISAVLRQ